jgi:hypothetical protein
MAGDFERDLGKARKTVEKAIAKLGLDPDSCTIDAQEGGAAWYLTRGSADVMVALNPGSGDVPGRLRLVAPIVRVDFDAKPALLMRLLELNATELPGIAFGVLGNKVVLLAERSVFDLDLTEVEELLRVIGHFADKYDDELVKQFGGARVCDTD